MRDTSDPESTDGQNAMFLASVPETYSGPFSLALDRELARLEEYLVAKALRQAGGNRTRAAGLLGIKRTRLVEFLKRKCAAIYAIIAPVRSASNQ